MTEVFYTLDLAEGVRKRHYHRVERGEVRDFVVQLQVRIEGRWMDVIRYDCSHGYAHRDRYNLKGEQRKEELLLDYKEVLTLADEDIRRNWRSYCESFLRGGYP